MFYVGVFNLSDGLYQVAIEQRYLLIEPWCHTNKACCGHMFLFLRLSFRDGLHPVEPETGSSGTKDPESLFHGVFF